nr:MAG: VP2 protein [Drosophila Glencorse burn reovirus]
MSGNRMGTGFKNKKSDKDEKDADHENEMSKDETPSPPKKEKQNDNLDSEKRADATEKAIANHKLANDGSAENTTRSDLPDTSVQPSSTIEKLISSLQLMEFMEIGSRILTEQKDATIDVLKLLSGRDEFTLNEIASLPHFYKTWFDQPNNVMYIHRNNEFFTNFTKISEYFVGRLKTLMQRVERSLVIMREPERIYIFNTPVCDPEKLGFPYHGLFENGIHDSTLLRIIENACEPHAYGNAYVELRCIGDKDVLLTNRNVITYSINNMQILLARMNEYINDICLLSRSEIQCLKVLSFNTFLFPSFSPFGISGVFDGLARSVDLRLSFNVPLIKNVVKWNPISQTDMVKTAALNVAKAGHVSDIVQHNWRDEYAPQLNAYDISWMHPGEILFDLQVPSNVDADVVNGFAGLLGKLMFTYSEKNSTICNSTDQMQIEFERQIIRFGSNLRAIEMIDVNLNSKFPLNDWKLIRGGASKNATFDWLKTKDGESGACANGNSYATNDSLIKFFPNIMRRRNYVLNLDDGAKMEEVPSWLAKWRTYQGVMALLDSCAFGASSYSQLMSMLAVRILQHYLRLNEYLKVKWYTMYRMNATASIKFRGDSLIQHAKVIQIRNDFIITVSKGLDSTYIIAENDPVACMRIQSAFKKEAFIVDLSLKYMEIMWKQSGSLNSFTQSRRKEIACSGSEIFSYIYRMLVQSNEAKKVNRIIRNLQFEENDLARCFAPLLRLNEDVERMYGVVNKVWIQGSLNWINKDLILNCLMNNIPLTNGRIIGENVLAEISYKEIERAIRERRFNSTFFKSSKEPFILKTKFPYTFSHTLTANVNETALVKSEHITGDVSYEHQVSNKTLQMLFVSMDRSDYRKEDDYVIGTHQVDEMFPLMADVHDTIIRASDFFCSLGTRSQKILVLSKKDYHFVSLFHS